MLMPTVRYRVRRWTVNGFQRIENARMEIDRLSRGQSTSDYYQQVETLDALNQRMAAKNDKLIAKAQKQMEREKARKKLAFRTKLALVLVLALAVVLLLMFWSKLQIVWLIH